MEKNGKRLWVREKEVPKWRTRLLGPSTARQTSRQRVLRVWCGVQVTTIYCSTCVLQKKITKQWSCIKSKNSKSLQRSTLLLGTTRHRNNNTMLARGPGTPGLLCGQGFEFVAMHCEDEVWPRQRMWGVHDWLSFSPRLGFHIPLTSSNYFEVSNFPFGTPD